MPLVRYGATWPEPEAGVDPSASIELAMAFNERFQQASGFLGRYQHFRNAVDLIWNEPRRQYALARKLEYDVRKNDAFIWNDWTELMSSTFCEWHETTAVWGPNASWKTTNAAVYGVAGWYASPADTIVVVTSTTLPGLRKRIWKEILKFHRVNPTMGVVNNTDFAIRFNKGSDEAGIFGIPTGQEEGDVEKAFNKIIGFHAPHVIVILDEGQATNEAIVKAGVSLRAGTERYQLIILGNPDTELDTLGQVSEPVGGYNSISADMDRWETKTGVCIHLDGLESPRIKEGDEFYPGLLRQADIDSTIRDYGDDSPEFWRGRRGFIAPQGVQKTVLSSAIITKFRAREKAIWATGFKLGAGLDPAYEGGDRCVLRLGKVGENDEGKMVIELGEVIIIKVSASSVEPIHFQISRQVKDICENHGITPDMFAMDSTGEGGGLASIIMREWSSSILQVEFGGMASKRAVSTSNPRPANEEYLYRVTELWYGFRTLVQNGQVRGLDQATAIEFCQRRYEMRGNLRMVESKTQMKGRTKRSPDLADATVVLTELFRQRTDLGAGSSSESTSTEKRDKWRDLARKYNNVDSDYLVV